MECTEKYSIWSGERWIFAILKIKKKFPKETKTGRSHVFLRRCTMGQNRNHAAKNKKIDFFSFRLKLISDYSKLFVDLSMYNVSVLC